MFLRKWSLKELYALLESESVLAHVDFSRSLNRRNACHCPVVNNVLLGEPYEVLPSSISTGAQRRKDYAHRLLLSQP